MTGDQGVYLFFELRYMYVHVKHFTVFFKPQPHFTYKYSTLIWGIYMCS